MSSIQNVVPTTLPLIREFAGVASNNLLIMLDVLVNYSDCMRRHQRQAPNCPRTSLDKQRECPTDKTKIPKNLSLIREFAEGSFEQLTDVACCAGR